MPAIRFGCDYMVSGSPAFRNLNLSIGGGNRNGVNDASDGEGCGSLETGVRQRPSPLHDIGNSTFWRILEPVDGCSFFLMIAIVLACATAAATQNFQADVFELHEVLFL